MVCAIQYLTLIKSEKAMRHICCLLRCVFGPKAACKTFIEILQKPIRMTYISNSPADKRSNHSVMTHSMTLEGGEAAPVGGRTKTERCSPTRPPASGQLLQCGLILLICIPELKLQHTHMLFFASTFLTCMHLCKYMSSLLFPLDNSQPDVSPKLLSRA